MVRPDDDLDAALETLDIADVALTGAINRLEGISALQKPSLDQLELGDEE